MAETEPEAVGPREKTWGGRHEGDWLCWGLGGRLEPLPTCWLCSRQEGTVESGLGWGPWMRATLLGCSSAWRPRGSGSRLAPSPLLGPFSDGLGHAVFSFFMLLALQTFVCCDVFLTQEPVGDFPVPPDFSF